MRDEVDEVVGAWMHERPDLCVEPMHIWSRISRLAIHLDEARRRAFAAQQIEPWEFDVLASLRRSGEPYMLSPGQLVKDTHVTSGTMTNRVDRLVSRGFVERLPDPEDGRGVQVRLTVAGRATVDAALEGLVAAEELLLSQIPASRRARLAAVLRTLLLAQQGQG